jgi:uncharacterized protein HemX
MLAPLIGLALKVGIPTRFAKIAVIGTLIVLLVVGLGVAKCAYDRSVIERHTSGQQAKQTKRERTADTNLKRQRDADEAAAAQRQQEIENATRNIPDQAPSARQRARACLELRRQAQADGRPLPTC